MRILLAFVFCVSCMVSYAQADINGMWKTIDDETGKPKSIVKIFTDDGVVKGKILDLINPKEPDPKCDKCEGAKKDQPVKGMEIIWGMKKNDDE